MTEYSSPLPRSPLLSVLRQIGNTAVTLLVTFIGLLAVTFIISRVVPIDPVTSILGERATNAQIEQTREALGLNDPLWQQFAIYLGDTLTGDLGTSIRTREPVLQEVARRFPATLELATLATVLGVLLGVPAGERRVLSLRFGLVDGYSRTLEEVGKQFKVTRERIRQIEAKRLKELQRRLGSRPNVFISHPPRPKPS